MKQTKQTKIETKTCESCNEDFTCGANTEKCWCFEVDLQSETLAELRKNFKNCLCPKCLVRTACVSGLPDINES